MTNDTGIIVVKVRLVIGIVLITAGLMWNTHDLIQVTFLIYGLTLLLLASITAKTVSGKYFRSWDVDNLSDAEVGFLFLAIVVVFPLTLALVKQNEAWVEWRLIWQLLASVWLWALAIYFAVAMQALYSMRKVPQVSETDT